MHGMALRKFIGRTVAAAALSAAAFGANVARADEPLPPEADTSPNVRPVGRVQVNLVLIGAAVTAGWYGAALGTSYLWSDSDGASPLRIPVAGPYMALAKTGCGAAEGPDCDTVGVVVRTVFTVLSAIGQTGGVLAMGEGLFLPTAPSSARRGGQTNPHWSLPPRVSVAPVAVGRSGFGLSLSGNF